MVNELEKKLMWLVKEEYYKLRMLNPCHELLKYNFWEKNKVRIPYDFIERFFPDAEDFFKIGSREGYEEILFLITFKNYLLALENAIRKAKEKIRLN
jgi:hypothetical protein